MSPLLRPDPARNRQLIAERLGWPEGSLEKCTALEEEFPNWTVYWTVGGTPQDPNPGYRASLRMHRHSSELYAPTDAGLREQLAAIDAELPRQSGLGDYRPLVVPGQRCYGSAGPEDDDCEYRWAHGEHPVGEMPAR